MKPIVEKKYPLNANDYTLCEEVGEGVSATVYRAVCIPLDEIVAIKVLDLERCNNDLDGIRREVKMMSLIDHPNLLRAHCSFTAGHQLWIVMPYMDGGSCLQLMKAGFSEGFEEPIIATLLHETLEALVYLHAQGHIHRDVKAGNILIDSRGTVKLADFGVSACMFDTGDRQRSRNTFVGTPCWMAPEVMQQLHGYDFKADIWSLGITALELAHGHAPFSKYPPMKVLLMTLQNAPPGLDYERDKKFSKSFKEMLATCLVKDPKRRPTSEKLLKHHFFKRARSNEYLAHAVLDSVDPLGERFRMLKSKEADLLLQRKNNNEDKEQLSQKEYIRGISAWNFDLEDLKCQAALIPDDSVSHTKESDIHAKQIDECYEISNAAPNLSPEKDHGLNITHGLEDALDYHDLESPFAQDPNEPLHALKHSSHAGKDLEEINFQELKNAALGSEKQFCTKLSTGEVAQQTERNRGEDIVLSGSLARLMGTEQSKSSSSLLITDNPLPGWQSTDLDRESPKMKCLAERNYSGPLSYRQRKDSGSFSSVEDTSEGTVIQRKGRFKVTGGDRSLKGATSCTFNGFGSRSTSPTFRDQGATSILQSLQYIFQQNVIQREELIRLIKHFELHSDTQDEYVESAIDDLLQIHPLTARERELQSQVMQLQNSIENLLDELQRQKHRNTQLERQLIFLANEDG